MYFFKNGVKRQKKGLVFYWYEISNSPTTVRREYWKKFEKHAQLSDQKSIKE